MFYRRNLSRVVRYRETSSSRASWSVDMATELDCNRHGRALSRQRLGARITKSGQVRSRRMGIETTMCGFLQNAARRFSVRQIGVSLMAETAHNGEQFPNTVSTRTLFLRWLRAQNSPPGIVGDSVWSLNWLRAKMSSLGSINQSNSR